MVGSTRLCLSDLLLFFTRLPPPGSSSTLVDLLAGDAAAEWVQDVEGVEDAEGIKHGTDLKVMTFLTPMGGHRAPVLRGSLLSLAGPSRPKFWGEEIPLARQEVTMGGVANLDPLVEQPGWQKTTSTTTRSFWEDKGEDKRR